MFGGLKRGIITLKSNDPYLSNLISEEKDAIAAIKQTHQSNLQASKYLMLWGEGEHSDVKDITTQYNNMANDFTMMMAEWEYAQHEFREKLKDIRTHSDTIANIKSKSKSATDKFTKAQKSGKPTDELSLEVRALEAQLKNELAAFESTKRSCLQQGMIAQFNGMKKFALKLEEYANFGAQLAHQIPQVSIVPGEQLPVYNGASTTAQIVKDFQNVLYTIKDPQLAFAQSKYGSKNSLMDMDNLDAFQPGLAAKPDVNLNDTEALWEADFEEDPVPRKSSTDWNNPPTSQFQEVSLQESYVAQAAECDVPTKPPRSTLSQSNAPLPTVLDENPW